MLQLTRCICAGLNEVVLALPAVPKGHQQTGHSVPGRAQSAVQQASHCLICVADSTLTEQVKSGVFLCTCTVIMCGARYTFTSIFKVQFKTFENFPPSYSVLMSLDEVKFLCHFYKSVTLSFLSRPILFCLETISYKELLQSNTDVE